MRPLVPLALMLLACTLTSTGCAKIKFWKRGESAKVLARGPKVGMVAPEIEGEDFAGRHVKLSDHRGKVVVVAFWASWCKPCVQLIPRERELFERYRDRPFVMLGVNNDNNPDSARKVIQAQHMSWPSCQTCGCDDPINKQWEVDRLPSLFVIDANGIVRHAPGSRESLEYVVEKLIVDVEGKRR